MRVFWTEEEDAVLRQYALTHKAEDIAAMLPGRTTRAVHHRFDALGIERFSVTHTMRKREYDAVLEARLGEPIETYLRRRYTEQRATYRELCAEMGIHNHKLAKYMRRFGIDPIDPVTAGKRNYEKHKEVYAHNLSLSNTDEARMKTAETRQRRWRKIISPQALAILEGLRAEGLDPQPEFALYRYNIDLAFPELALAVEVDGGNWHQSEKHLRLQAQKEKYLAEQGWQVLRVGTNDPVHQNVSKISSAVKSLASTHPR